MSARIEWWTRLFIVISFLALYEVGVRLGWMAYIDFSTPSAIALKLFHMVQAGEFYEHLSSMVFAFLVGFALSASIGILLGHAMWKSKTFSAMIEPVLLTGYSIPIILFYPIFLVLFGIGRFPIIIIGFAMSVIPIALNVKDGFYSIANVYIRVGMSMNISKVDLYRKVLIPAALPYLAMGLRLGAVMAMVATIAAEFLLADRGIGYLASNAYNLFEVDELYASIVLIILITGGFDLVLKAVVKYIQERF